MHKSLVLAVKLSKLKDSPKQGSGTLRARWTVSDVVPCDRRGKRPRVCPDPLAGPGLLAGMSLKNEESSASENWHRHITLTFSYTLSESGQPADDLVLEPPQPGPAIPKEKGTLGVKGFGEGRTSLCHHGLLLESTELTKCKEEACVPNPAFSPSQDSL